MTFAAQRFAVFTKKREEEREKRKRNWSFPFLSKATETRARSKICLCLNTLKALNGFAFQKAPESNDNIQTPPAHTGDLIVSEAQSCVCHVW